MSDHNSKMTARMKIAFQCKKCDRKETVRVQRTVASSADTTELVKEMFASAAKRKGWKKLLDGGTHCRNCAEAL